MDPRMEDLEEWNPKRGAAAGEGHTEPVRTRLRVEGSLEAEASSMWAWVERLEEHRDDNGKGAAALDERERRCAEGEAPGRGVCPGRGSRTKQASELESGENRRGVANTRGRNVARVESSRE